MTYKGKLQKISLLAIVVVFAALLLSLGSRSQTAVNSGEPSIPNPTPGGQTPCVKGVKGSDVKQTLHAGGTQFFKTESAQHSFGGFKMEGEEVSVVTRFQKQDGLFVEGYTVAKSDILDWYNNIKGYAEDHTAFDVMTALGTDISFALTFPYSAAKGFFPNIVDLKELKAADLIQEIETGCK